MALLVVLVVSVTAVVLVMRAAAAPGGAARRRAPRPRPPARNHDTVRPVAPDDDPEFLRELARRVRRDDSPA